jgi:uncharacterized protein YbjT (DUF2867 family)
MLLAQGQPVRILARSQSNYQPLAEAGAQVVLGDLKERGSLDAACQGVEIVITTANSAARGGEDNVQTVDLEGNRHLIDEARAAGVKQFIFVSALTADLNSPIPLMQAKGKTEDYLRGRGLPYTILAPNGYMEMWIGMAVGMPAMMGHPVTIVGEAAGSILLSPSAMWLRSSWPPSATRRPSIRSCCSADRTPSRCAMPWRSTSGCLATIFKSAVWLQARQCQASQRRWPRC